MRMEVDDMVRKLAGFGLIGLVCCAVSAQAQDFFDFSDVPGIDADPIVQIDLTPEVFGFMTVAAGAGAGDEAAELLAGIEGVRVRVYEDVRNPRRVAEFIDDAAQRLEQAGWTRPVRIAHEDDRVRMYVRLNEGEITGMTVLASSDDEAVFVSLAGTVNPELLGHVARTFGSHRWHHSH
jgi:hypothetical protein